MEPWRSLIYRTVSKRVFVNTVSKVQTLLGSPLINRISFLVSLIDFVIGELRQRNERLSIGVITFYARQRELIEEELKSLGHASAVLVRTVDAFQVRDSIYWNSAVHALW